MNGHHDHLTGLAFSSDSRQLASTGWDRTVRVWDVGPAERIDHRGHTGPVWCVGFGPGGHTLISASNDRTVRNWDPNVRQEFAESRIALNSTRAERYGPTGKSQAASPAGSGVVVSGVREVTPLSRGSRQLTSQEGSSSPTTAPVGPRSRSSPCAGMSSR